MKSLSTTVVVVAVLGLLAYTNPQMASFEQFIHAQILQGTEKKDEVTKALGSLLGGVASRFIANSATRSDYVFFSLYRATYDGKDVTVLGVLNNFIVVNRSNPESRRQDGQGDR
jgi:hypothetical protein